jgi:hypothetical protein
MSFEEWGDIVLDKTRAREAREAELAKAHVATLEELAAQGKEDDEAAYDAATMRKRGFEDWADGVPKGAGVTKRV